MKGYKEPGFEVRAASSARAKNIALDKLKAAPKPDEAELAARAAREQQREAKAAAKREAKANAQRFEQEQTVEEEKERARAEPPSRTEAERKAARDARYAARKNRKR
jgi:hypothetical protein